MKMMFTLLVLVGVCGFIGWVDARLVLDTTPFWNVTSTTGPVAAGPGLSRAIGQTFTVLGKNTVLENFSFFIESNLPLEYSGVLMRWDTDRVTGTVLYQNTIQTSTNIFPITQITFYTGGIGLTEGDEYIIFLDTSSDSNLRFGVTFDNKFQGGELVGSAWGANFNQLANTSWNRFSGSGMDAAFTAAFSRSVIPESSTFVLFGIGILGILGYGWRRQKD